MYFPVGKKKRLPKKQTKTTCITAPILKLTGDFFWGALFKISIKCPSLEIVIGQEVINDNGDALTAVIDQSFIKIGPVHIWVAFQLVQ